ncbi:RAP domain-containing protein [Plasmodiophora brassicae]|uniref:RAP domain-containing protein n=1 Tax=Plasmodiophora brassicae TaxID=37360 RepID=A0A0G4ISZ7_PLABS|nr:hypothetical protein PBRA_006592 [Plasmodiophora brassicae]
MVGGRRNLLRFVSGGWRRRPTRRYGASFVPRGAKQDALLINRDIVQCATVDDLVAVLDKEMGAGTRPDLSHLNQVNVCTAFHRLAKLHLASWTSLRTEVRGALIARLTDCVPQFDARHFPNLLWAFAVLRGSIFADPEAEGLFEGVLRRAESVYADPQVSVQPQFLSNMLWALSLLERRQQALLECLGSRAQALFTSDNATGGFRSQEFANIVWGFGRLHAGTPELFDTFANAVGPVFDSVAEEESLRGLPQTISNVSLGFAHSAHASEPARRAALEACESKAILSQFTEQGLCNVAWSMGLPKICLPNFLGGIAVELESRRTIQRPVHWLIVLWSMIRCEFMRESLFVTFGNRVTPHVKRLGDRDLQSCLSLYRRADVHSPRFVNAVIQEAERRQLVLLGNA